MNWRDFLDSAYTLLLEEYQRIGLDLLTALEKVREWAAGPAPTAPLAVVDEVRQNEQSLAQFEAMMLGVSKG